MRKTEWKRNRYEKRKEERRKGSGKEKNRK